MKAFGRERGMAVGERHSAIAGLRPRAHERLRLAGSEPDERERQSAELQRLASPEIDCGGRSRGSPPDRLGPCGFAGRGLLDGGADAHIGRRSGRCCPTWPHRSRRRWDSACLREQSGGRHDLARLAVTALDDVHVEPRFWIALPPASLPMPSMVVTVCRRRCPPAARRSGRPRPSRWTVHAPHCAMPQPNLVPMSPITSRSTQSNGMSAGASTECFSPLMLNTYIFLSPYERDPERHMRR